MKSITVSHRLPNPNIIDPGEIRHAKDSRLDKPEKKTKKQKPSNRSKKEHRSSKLIINDRTKRIKITH